MKKIPLTQGQFALVDDEDFKWLSQWKWRAYKGEKTFYATREANNTSVQMHRVIMKTPAGMECDHINHNGLHNYKTNLRNCTHAQNHGNQVKPITNTSGYKGVSWNKEHKKYGASIRHENHANFLGYYELAEDAAKAYDRAAVELFGEFANPNFPMPR